MNILKENQMDNIERIDRYLNDQMNAEEKQAFDAEIAANPKLAEELSLQRDMNNFLQRKDRRELLQNQLKDISGDYFKTEQEQASAKVVQLPRRRLRWMIAASAAAVIALLLVWQFLLAPTLYDQYAQYAPLALAEK
jgi:anti-sigma factor RsiW